MGKPEDEDGENRRAAWGSLCDAGGSSAKNPAPARVTLGPDKYSVLRLKIVTFAQFIQSNYSEISGSPL